MREGEIETEEVGKSKQDIEIRCQVFSKRGWGGEEGSEAGGSR